MRYRTLFTGIAIAISCIAYTQQNPFMNDANGRPLFWGSSYVADGSPYFNEEYNWAEIITLEGKVYKDIRVKFNVMDRVVQYLAEDGKEMIATLPIKSIRFPVIPSPEGLNNTLLWNPQGALNTPAAPVYEVLDSGRISFFKKIDITYRDEKKYSEAVITRHFDRKESYYFLLPDGTMTKLDKSRSFITDLLKDKKTEVDTYIDANKIKCKTVKDMQLIIKYYNSLFI
jgi:hypothetical protein